MKKIKFIIPLFLLISSVLLSCYTQLRAPHTETMNYPNDYNDEEYYVRDSVEVDKEIIVHHYYHYADPFYYDPWYDDPWYWRSAFRWGVYVGFSSFWWYPWDWYRPCCYPIITPYAWYYPHYYGWYPYYPPIYYTYKDFHKRPWDRRGFEPTRRIARGGGSSGEKQIATGNRRSTSENSTPIFVSGSRSGSSSSTRIVQRNSGNQQGVSTSSSEKQNVSSPRTINRQEPASSRQPGREAVRPSRSSQRSSSGSYSPKSRSGSNTTSSSGSHKSSENSGSHRSGSSIRSTDRGSSSGSSSSHGGQSSSSSSGRSSSSGNSSSGSSSRSTNRK